MDVVKLKEIAEYILKTASDDDEGIVVAEAVQHHFKCNDVYINKMVNILKTKGTFSKGVGDLEWRTFTIDHVDIDLFQSKNDNKYNIIQNDNSIQNEIDVIIKEGKRNRRNLIIASIISAIIGAIILAILEWTLNKFC